MPPSENNFDFDKSSLKQKTTQLLRGLILNPESNCLGIPNNWRPCGVQHCYGLAWTNHKFFTNLKFTAAGPEMVTLVPVKVIMFGLGSLGQANNFGVKCVNVFRLFYQNWLRESEGIIQRYLWRGPSAAVSGTCVTMNLEEKISSNDAAVELSCILMNWQIQSQC